jgi:DNA-binding NarL/FixJ family response regulator
MLDTNDNVLAKDLEASPSLSTRELEVLEMVAQGLTNTRIGVNLQLSVHGVKFHLSSIYRKLHVANRTEAATVYLKTQSKRAS